MIIKNQTICVNDVMEIDLPYTHGALRRLVYDLQEINLIGLSYFKCFAMDSSVLSDGEGCRHVFVL